MKTTILTAALTLLAVTLPATAVAGYECPEDTDACVEKMVEMIQQKGWVGIEMDSKDAKEYVTLTRVVAGGPASKAGLQAGDVLLSLNGIPYNKENEEALGKAYKGFKPGSTVTFRVRRGSREIDFEFELVPVPQHIMAQWIGQHILQKHLEPQEKDAIAEKD